MTDDDVYSAKSFRTWLEAQDQSAEYDFRDLNGGCLLDRYFVAVTGRVSNGPEYVRLARVETAGRNLGTVAADYPRTHGDALTRLGPC